MIVLLTLLVLAAGCAGSGSGSSTAGHVRGVAVNETFTLARGESASVDGEDLRVTFTDVKADSRCPKNVVCVWAGDAAIAVTAASGAESRDLELHTNPQFAKSAEAFGHIVELVELAPVPEDPGSIAQDDYVAHLVVR